MNTGVALELNAQAQESRIVVGIGEYAVADQPDATIVTHALGSCIAVCAWDPDAGVGGLLHFMLPTGSLSDAGGSGNEMPNASTFDASMPSSMDWSFHKLRSMRPAPVSSTTGVSSRAASRSGR